MDVLFDEIESLEAILMDDVKITKNSETNIPEMIETIVLPTVGDQIDSQYVCITLQVIFTNGYPDAKPMYQLRNPRGLDDSGIEKIRTACERKMIESLGAPVVFDLIDVIREHLTESNLPSGQCVVCLYGFQEGDAFTKTECYHHFHSYCLARHLDASKHNYDEEQEKLPAWQRKTSKPYQAYCPVCREAIGDDAEPLRSAKLPSELQNAPDFELTNDLKGLQARMANLYMHQKKRGGIIDLNADDCNVISIDSEFDANEAQARKTKSKNNTPSAKLEQSENKTPGVVPHNQSSVNASRRPSKNGNVSKKLQQTERTEKDAAVDDDDDEDEDEDKRRRNSHYGRRGGARHRRNAYHHHHHHHNHQRSHQHHNAKLNSAATAAAATEHANQASSSNAR